jgi:hypothetical protein
VTCAKCDTSVGVFDCENEIYEFYDCVCST